MSGVKLVYYPAPAKVYSPEEMREIFSAFGQHDPLIAALRQIFQTRLASAAVDAANPALTERAAGHVGGRIQEVMEFREEILGYLKTSDPDVAAARHRKARA